MKNKYRNRILVSIGFFLLGLTRLLAQGQLVTGKITDEKGLEMPGVNVVIKGTSQGTSSNAKGQYSIRLATGQDVLNVSFIGYQPQEVKVGGRTTINIKLVEDVASLDEVRVVSVGYGKADRSNLTGAQTTISEQEIKRSVNTTLEQALQGRAAGVEVTQNSGTPGGGVTVNIRGINSINGNNQPLYVIDGIQIDGSASNVLATINPSDIISLDVLKDASATAIYGSRASNGVIIINTRRGEAGKTKVSYEAYYGIQQLPKRIPVMNLREYAEYSNVRSQLLGFGAREVFASPSLLGEGTSWQNELFGSAPMQNHHLSLSGGNDRTKFALSAGYFDQNGIAIGSNFKRYDLRLNVETQAANWLKVGANLIGSRTNQRITVTQSNLVYLALRQRPDIVARNPDGSWGYPTEENFGNYTTNVIAEALSRQNDRKQTQLLSTVYADITPLKGLVNHAELSTNIGYTNSYVFNPSLNLGPFLPPNESSGSRSADNSFNWQFRDYLTYNHRFGQKHDLTALIGYEAQESNYENLSAARSRFFTNNIQELPIGDASTATNSSGRGSNSILSYFSRVNYSFGDRYLLTATLRRDASSRFGENFRWGTFPSFSAAWKITNEPFFQRIKPAAIDNLKLRAGYGQVGNQGWENFGYGVALNNVRTVWGTGVIPANIANPDLRWETSKATNIGLDINLFKYRVEVIADAYLKRTNDLLLRLPLPSYAGTTGAGAISAPLVNLGDLENKGFELTINTVNMDKGDFKWRTSLIYSLNRNRVVSLVNKDALIASGVVSQTRVGQPIGIMYGYQVDGMFNQLSDFYQKDAQGNILKNESGQPLKVALPKEVNGQISPDRVWLGDYRFKDLNNDGVIDEKDRTIIGNPQPKFQYGFTNNFSYKGFDLSIFLQGVYGNQIYNTLRTEFENPSSLQGLLKTVTNYAKLTVINPALTVDPADGVTRNPDQIPSNVIVSNPGTLIPRMTTSNGLNANYRASDRFVEDGSYMRIKNISLGYNLPKGLLSKMHMNAIRAYVNVQNLYTFTKYSGYDPEVGGNSALEFGVESGRYPTPRIFTFGLNASL